MTLKVPSQFAYISKQIKEGQVAYWIKVYVFKLKTRFTKCLKLEDMLLWKE